MKLDVCLETVFDDLPVEARIAKIAEAGYTHVEFWLHDSTCYRPGVNLPGPKDPAAIRQACAAYGVTVNDLVINVPDGGIGGAPVKAEELNRYLERVEEVITFAKSIGCHKGITCTGNEQPDLTRAQMRANLENALGRAAEIAARHDFLLVLEALNTHVDHAGYYLYSSLEGADIVRSVASPNVKLLYDVYHMQIMEGNLINNITRNLDVIGHFHSAGVPGRHELFGGEINYPKIVSLLVEHGYTGCFGLEYMPLMPDHMQSLKEIKAYLLGVSVAC
jgi:hydroxypyruvate isomerase